MSGRRDDRVTGGQDDRSSISGPPLDGAFLLQLLRRPPQVQPTSPPPAYPPHEVRQPHRDPAVGPTYPFRPQNFFPSPRPPPPSQPPDHYPGALRFSPPPLPDFHQGPRASPGFPPSGIDHRNSHIPGSRPFFRGDPNTSSPSSASDLRSDLGYQPRGGFPADSKPRSFSGNRNMGSRGLDERSMPNGPNPRPGFRKVTAGSVAGVDNELACRMGPGISDAGLSRGPLERNLSHIAGPRRHETFPRSGMNEWRRPPGSQPQSKGSGEWVPPGSQPRSKGSGEWVALKGRGDGGHIMEKGENHVRKVNYGSSPSSQEGDLLWRERLNSHGSDGEVHTTRPLVNHQLDQSGDASGSNLHSIEGSDSEEYLNGLQNEAVEGTVELLKHVKHGGVDGFSSGKDAYKEQDVLADRLMDSLIHKDDSVDMKVIRHSDTRRGKDLRSDSLRGRQILSQRMRIRRRETECRHDMETLAPRFLSIYESLIPADEEKAKQKQLLLSLVKLVTKEWPNAQLHLYGSCANSFGFSNSDIDICLAINDNNMSKAEILLKLADILQSNNLENVQALTRARVPIVKMMDPVTGISCDICVNNLLAVVNTKLLRDYARIDERLRQLAFIVKHWAKSRGVNETYRGTLSSYAYVIMCIHFLQLRKPAILPCLQGMVATCLVTVDGVECAYFDQVEKLHDFGAGNNESIARLLWAFFHYWAYYHDYTDDVISVRTGRIISKRAKDWTRRIGMDRHLLCIEDPFETSHDLGRVVDKFSIKILREEFERAAYILQYDPNPSVTLFEPYAPGPTLN